MDSKGRTLQLGQRVWHKQTKQLGTIVKMDGGPFATVRFSMSFSRVILSLLTTEPPDVKLPLWTVSALDQEGKIFHFDTDDAGEAAFCFGKVAKSHQHGTLTQWIDGDPYTKDEF